MTEMAQLSSATMSLLAKSFGLRPGMSMDEIREAMRKNRHHACSGGPAGTVEGMDGGAHLLIGKKAYTPGELQKLLDAQSLPAAAPERAVGRTITEIEDSARAHMNGIVQNVVGLGRDLAEAKAQLKHGEWLPWLDRMGIGQDRAAGLIRISENAAPDSAVARLPFTKALAVLALPEPEREQFAQEHGGESVREIKRLIAEREQMKKERDSLAEGLRKAKERAAAAEREAYTAKNAEPQTVKVVEVPDDYQQLKSAVAHHQAEIEEAAQAAEDAERRAAAAEAEAARLRREQGGRRDRIDEAARAANDFLIAAQLLPYDPAALGSAENRRRLECMMKPVRAWVLEMQRALEFGALDAEGAIV